MIFVPITLATLTALSLSWLLICNHRTFEHRSRVLDAIISRYGGTERFWTAICEVRHVRYNDHMWALVLLRDPWQLYSSVVHEALDE